MSIESDRLKHERAKEQDRQCRRNGGKREACPYRAGTMNAERAAWMAGFKEEDMMARRAKR